MSSSTAELTLIIKAQNLADNGIGKVKDSLNGIVATAKVVASDVALAFKDVGKRIARQMGNLATDILSGGSIQTSLIAVGATMAGAVVEGLSAHLIPEILAKVAGTSVFAPVAAAMAAGGVTAGTAFDLAVGVTMAALPFVILAAAVAALVYLVANPEARQKAKDVALMIIGRVGDGLRALQGLILTVFQKAMTAARDAVITGIRVIVGFIMDLPRLVTNLIITLPAKIGAALLAVQRKAQEIVGNIVDAILAIPRAVQKAIDSLTHMNNVQTPAGRTSGFGPPAHAAGGWVGLNGPELGWLGEKGPEYVVPNDKLGSMKSSPGFTIKGVSERDIIEMVDRGLYFKLRRAAPTLSPS